jgi:hypothetical protein
VIRKPVVLRVALCLASLAALLACASSYCGAPCDKAPQAPAKPQDNHVNQYGSLYGYLEVDSLTRVQMNIEKNSLEFLIKADPRDAEILKALKAQGDSAYAFRYEDYSTGGNRFDATGKLRRPRTSEAGTGRIARLIGDSQNRELFERYRKIRWRLIQEDRTAALVPPPVLPPPPPDTQWAGAYRVDSDTLAPAAAKFPVVDSCAVWGAATAERFRHKAFAFEFECRRDTVLVKRKVW